MSCHTTEQLAGTTQSQENTRDKTVLIKISGFELFQYAGANQKVRVRSVILLEIKYPVFSALQRNFFSACKVQIFSFVKVCRLYQIEDSQFFVLYLGIF